MNNFDLKNLVTELKGLNQGQITRAMTSINRGSKSEFKGIDSFNSKYGSHKTLKVLNSFNNVNTFSLIGGASESELKLRTQELDNRKINLDTKESTLNTLQTRLSKKETDLNKREAELNSRDTILKTGETKLAQEKTAFQKEKDTTNKKIKESNKYNETLRGIGEKLKREDISLKIRLKKFEENKKINLELKTENERISKEIKNKEKKLSDLETKIRLKIAKFNDLIKRYNISREKLTAELTESKGEIGQLSKNFSKLMADFMKETMGELEKGIKETSDFKRFNEQKDL